MTSSQRGRLERLRPEAPISPAGLPRATRQNGGETCDGRKGLAIKRDCRSPGGLLYQQDAFRLAGVFRKMPIPHASQALARFTVLDLTRVRAGPTCVRQLADWGANVVKVDALLEDSGEQLGGPRQGSDFQNLHRNKRAMSLN